VALVIGNSDYKHARVLPNPRNDAEAIAALLRQIGFAAGDVILKTDLDYKALRAEVRAFAAKAAGADMAIVYYAGHGIEVGGENYLVPVDARLMRDRDLEYEAVTLASVLDAVSEARRLKLVILDACRDNPLAHKIDLRAGVTRKVTRGLERIEPAGDVLVAYAARAGTVAIDGTGKHSPFAEALLKHMPTPGIDVFRLFGRVSAAVLDATGRQQEPWLYGRPGGETVALVPAAPKLVLPPLPPPPGVPPPADGLSATEAARICGEVAGMASLSVLGAMADQHKGSAAGRCIAARIDELTKAEAERKAEAQKKAEADRKAAAERRAEADRRAEAERKAAAQRKNAEAEKKMAVAPPQGTYPSPATPPKASSARPAPAPVTECDRLAARPGAAPAGLLGVDQLALDTARAIPACREAVSRYPAELRFQVWLARTLTRVGRYAEARDLYEKAADKGSADAISSLGYIHKNGLGVRRDYAKARAFYEKAAAAGSAAAMNNLGVLYRDGLGVDKSVAIAHSWYEKAAEHGDPVAMHNLALNFGQGESVARNAGTAGRYLLAAARAGNTKARSELDGNMGPWAHDVRRAVQALLLASGDYMGSADGQWGPASQAAAKAYYLRRN
jgi:TPR repeat protein